jgi:hypothetical protein
VVLVLGYLLMAFALLSAHQGSVAEFTGRPTCDNQPMARGDTCQIIIQRGGNLSITDRTYAEVLASQQASAKEGPWLRGAIAGTAGIILVFWGAGGRLVFRKRSTRRAILGFLLAAATGPLLGISVVVGLVELRYDRDLRERSLFLMLPYELPGTPLLMFVLVMVATGITFMAVRPAYQRDPYYGHVYPSPPRPAAPTAGLPPGWPPVDTLGQPAAAPPFPGRSGLPPGLIPHVESSRTHALPPSPPAPVRKPPSAPLPPRPETSTFTPQETWIVTLRLGQFAVAVAAALWIGALSHWHLGYLLLVLAGTVVVAMMGVDHASTSAGAQLAFQLLSLAVGLGAAAASAWLGSLSGWHAGIIAGYWTAVTVAIYASGSAVEALRSSAEKAPGDRPGLPVPALVPVALLAIGVGATVLIGDASGWRWYAVLVVWAGITVVTIAYATASLGLIRQGTGGRLVATARRTGAVPVGLVLTGVVVTGWLGGRTDWHAGFLLPAWLAVAAMMIVPEAVAAHRAAARAAQPAAESEQA